MTVWDALLMGAVQGLTEFLPVSSSGHLAILKALTGWGEEAVGALWEVAVHGGTLLAILLVFRRDLAALVRGVAGYWAVRLSKAEAAMKAEHRAAWHLALAIFVGTIPAGVVGIFLKDRIESVFGFPAMASGMLVVTGVVLGVTAFVKQGTKREVSLRCGLVIGAAQAVALLPGISRSGATICIALMLGIERSEAGRFSFLLALPALSGAALLKAGECAAYLSGQLLPATAAVMSAFVVGTAALSFLMGVVRRGKLHWFSAYCTLLGLAGLFHFLW